MSSYQPEKIINEVDKFFDAAVALRRDIHAHPELSWQEERTSALIFAELERIGLSPKRIGKTGVYCDLGSAEGGEARVALRADIDALPIAEASGLPFTSIVPNVSHACGHDVHTAVLLGTAFVLNSLHLAGELAVPVRLIFQPAEEVQPGGALELVDNGVLDGVGSIYALHCDPRFDVGTIGTRIGPITSAADTVSVVVESAGGHTSRPHLTGDVVYALGQIISQTPAILARRLDPRSGVNLTWGSVNAGNAHNAIPDHGELWGTLRCLDVSAWQRAADVLTEAVHAIAGPYQVSAQVEHRLGVPPVDNDADCTERIEAAAASVISPQSVELTEQSLGGEDFAWYLTRVPGALARLGTRTPGGKEYDIHRADLVIDEEAIRYGMRLLSAIVLRHGE